MSGTAPARSAKGRLNFVLDDVRADGRLPDRTPTRALSADCGATLSSAGGLASTLHTPYAPTSRAHSADSFSSGGEALLSLSLSGNGSPNGSVGTCVTPPMYFGNHPPNGMYSVRMPSSSAEESISDGSPGLNRDYGRLPSADDLQLSAFNANGVNGNPVTGRATRGEAGQPPSGPQLLPPSHLLTSSAYGSFYHADLANNASNNNNSSTGANAPGANDNVHVNNNNNSFNRNNSNSSNGAAPCSSAPTSTTGGTVVGSATFLGKGLLAHAPRSTRTDSAISDVTPTNGRAGSGSSAGSSTPLSPNNDGNSPPCIMHSAPLITVTVPGSRSRKTDQEMKESRDRRKMKNRVSAAASRERKKKSFQNIARQLKEAEEKCKEMNRVIEALSLQLEQATLAASKGQCLAVPQDLRGIIGKDYVSQQAVFDLLRMHIRAGQNGGLAPT